MVTQSLGGARRKTERKIKQITAFLGGKKTEKRCGGFAHTKHTHTQNKHGNKRGGRREGKGSSKDTRAGLQHHGLPILIDIGRAGVVGTAQAPVALQVEQISGSLHRLLGGLLAKADEEHAPEREDFRVGGPGHGGF